MIEACVRCLCPEFRVDDLRITLRRGDVYFCTEAVARASTDLREATRIGAVEVLWGERCVSERVAPATPRRVVVPTAPTPKRTPKQPRTLLPKPLVEHNPPEKKSPSRAKKKES